MTKEEMAQSGKPFPEKAKTGVGKFQEYLAKCTQELKVKKEPHSPNNDEDDVSTTSERTTPKQVLDKTPPSKKPTMKITIEKQPKILPPPKAKK